MLVQPGKRCPVKLIQATGRHHSLEGLEQWLDDHAEDPEFPILLDSTSHILIKHVFHVIRLAAADRDPCGREQLLAGDDGGVELLNFFPKPPSLLLHLHSLLLQLGDVLHSLLQCDGMASLLGIIGDQTVQGVKAHPDIKTPFLFG